MRSLRVAAATFLFGGMLSVAAPAPVACAAQGPRAVLVVDTERPGGQHRFCVALDDDEVSGIRLIELAHDQYGLDYRLGYGGNAVCVLAGVGYESDECLEEGPEFWGYWRGDGSGGWEWSSSGAHATVVEDGDVEGWSWGTGNDGSSHPQPPRTTFGSVCAEPEADDDDGGEKAESSEGVVVGGKDKKVTSPGLERAADTQDDAKKRSPRRDNDKKKKKSGGTRDKKRDKIALKHSAAPAPTVDVASEETSGNSGPPVGAWAALAATALFVAGGIVMRRRRQTP